MSGDVDPLYIAARATLLDALDALADHRTSIILVGAQAIYIHTGDVDIAVAPFTADGDLALDPRQLGSQPALEAAMQARGFTLKQDQVGIWTGERRVEANIITIDLLVPDSLGGPGSRGARLEGHDYRAARKVRGIEGCLVDKSIVRISSLEPRDQRVFDIDVAGPAALLVSKCHKLAERLAESRPRRVKPKDAYDVLRILRVVALGNLLAGFSTMARDEVSRETAATGLEHLQSLFGRPRLAGSNLAAQAAAGLEDETTVRESCVALTGDLIEGLGR